MSNAALRPLETTYDIRINELQRSIIADALRDYARRGRINPDLQSVVVEATLMVNMLNDPNEPLSTDGINDIADI